MKTMKKFAALFALLFVLLACPFRPSPPTVRMRPRPTLRRRKR